MEKCRKLHTVPYDKLNNLLIEFCIFWWQSHYFVDTADKFWQKNHILHRDQEENFLYLEVSEKEVSFVEYSFCLRGSHNLTLCAYGAHSTTVAVGSVVVSSSFSFFPTIMGFFPWSCVTKHQLTSSTLITVVEEWVLHARHSKSLRNVAKMTALKIFYPYLNGHR
jgi:hypothetical protein